MSSAPSCIREYSKTGRTEAQLANHYLVEKSLADKIRSSTREERMALFPILYDELFKKVPDHPRLTRRVSAEESARTVAARLSILKNFLKPDTVFMEIAPGDCQLAAKVAEKVKKVYAADISDQRVPGMQVPDNFEMVVFDGLNLEVEPGSVDVAFSYQFLEHLHPDDIAPHFELVARALKPGGSMSWTPRIPFQDRMTSPVISPMSPKAFTCTSGPMEKSTNWAGGMVLTAPACSVSGVAGTRLWR